MDIFKLFDEAFHLPYQSFRSDDATPDTPSAIQQVESVYATPEDQSPEETDLEDSKQDVNYSEDDNEIPEDLQNLWFSHMPKLPCTTFRFQVGEIAYIKWLGELNLVVIHFASQKLVTAPGNYLEYQIEDSKDDHADDIFHDCDDDTTWKETQTKGNAVKSAQHDTPSALIKRSNNTSPAATDEAMQADRISDTKYHMGDDGDDKVAMEDVGKEQKKRSKARGKNPKRENKASASQTNETNTNFQRDIEIFSDPYTEVLYSETNTIKPLSIRCDKDDPPIVEKGKSRSDKPLLVRRYMVPIYFVSFPGYKKRCAKAFRFWVKEKDLIKYYSVKQVKGKANRTELVVQEPSEGHVSSPEWDNRVIEDIDKYVYDTMYKKYNDDMLATMYNIGRSKVPWYVPRSLKMLVAAQQAEIRRHDMKNVDLYSVDVMKHFSVPPMVERLSAYAIVQNFKFILIKMASLIGPPTEKEELDIPTRRRRNAKQKFDRFSSSSLRVIEHLKSALDGGIKAVEFQDVYVSNMYWLDLYLKWIDNSFVNLCCYNEVEYEFLSMLKAANKSPMSRILGFEHLARLFCFDTMYNVFLRLIYNVGERVTCYMPVTELFISYMTFVASDYMNDQKYIISHLKDYMFDLPQRRRKR